MNYLETIRRTLEEHRKIRSDVQQVGQAMNDVEAVFAMQRAQAGWAQSPMEALPEGVDRLRQTVDAVKKGLTRHFAFEEQYLPPVFGETLMKALVFEHVEIGRKISDCSVSIPDDVSGMAQDKLLASRSMAQQTISDLIQAFEAHASREDTILRMMERALEAEPKANQAPGA